MLGGDGALMTCFKMKFVMTQLAYSKALRAWCVGPDGNASCTTSVSGSAV